MGVLPECKAINPETGREYRPPIDELPEDTPFLWLDRSDEGTWHDGLREWRCKNGTWLRVPERAECATIGRFTYERKRAHHQAGPRGVDGMDPADEWGDVWWTSLEAGGTTLTYGYIEGA